MTRTPNRDLERAILDEARRVLLDEGYCALSMRRIAGAVGCTATSIYLYYKSKDELVHALIDEGVDRLSAELESAVSGSLEAEERLVSLCRAYLDFGLANRELYEVMFMLQAQSMERYPADKFRRAHRSLDAFVNVLGQTAHGKGRSAAELEVSATVIWAALHGTLALVIAKRIHARTDLESLTRIAVEHAARMAQVSQPKVGA